MRYFDPFDAIDRTQHNLPHWQQNGVGIFVTWRLADSVPAPFLAEWRAKQEKWLKGRRWEGESEGVSPLTASERQEHQSRFLRPFHDCLDEGHGSCVLRDSKVRDIVVNALAEDDATCYQLDAYVIMPNHVHVLFSPLFQHVLPDILRRWKGATARKINQRLGKEGEPVWQSDYFDRLVRNAEHHQRVIDYLRANPMKARLEPGEFVLWVRE